MCVVSIEHKVTRLRNGSIVVFHILLQLINSVNKPRVAILHMQTILPTDVTFFLDKYIKITCIVCQVSLEQGGLTTFSINTGMNKNDIN